jgi:Leucine-rich repeat (LRR) protein
LGCNLKKEIATDSKEKNTEQEKDWETQIQLLRNQQTDSIEITATAITDSQFKDLAEQGELRRLILDQGAITDASAPTLGTLKELVLIKLRNCPLTDTAASFFREIESLQFLNIPQAEFSASGLKALAGHPNLRQLRISGNLLDDDACRLFNELPELRFLHLIGPKITGVGIEHLTKIEKLQSLYVDDCPAPESAWEVFFKSRPDVHVHLDQHHLDRDPAKHAHQDKE